MIKVNAIGVAFKPAGKIYDFLSCGVEAQFGDKVIVETEKGEDMANVILAPREIEVEERRQKSDTGRPRPQKTQRKRRTHSFRRVP